MPTCIRISPASTSILRVINNPPHLRRLTNPAQPHPSAFHQLRPLRLLDLRNHFRDRLLQILPTFTPSLTNAPPSLVNSLALLLKLLDALDRLQCPSLEVRNHLVVMPLEIVELILQPPVVVGLEIRLPFRDLRQTLRWLPDPPP